VAATCLAIDEVKPPEVPAYVTVNAESRAVSDDGVAVTNGSAWLPAAMNRRPA
jgi:hypothetical protein